MRTGCVDTSGDSRVGVYSLRQSYGSFIVESPDLDWSGAGLVDRAGVWRRILVAGRSF